MSYQILPTLIFLLAIFAAILMVLRRLPETEAHDQIADELKIKPIFEKLSQKGLPAQSFSRIKHYSVFWTKKIWRFMLEAKEIVPTGAAVLKIKKLFAAKPKSANPSLPIVNVEEESADKREADYLEAIKKEPKNFSHYDSLGKFYLQNEQFSDANDVFLYLTSHASGIADYWAHLGFTEFRLKSYIKAAEAYKKSIALDSSQPNRYYNLAQCLKAAGRQKAAIDAINKALSMDPQNFKFLEFKSRIGKQ